MFPRETKKPREEWREYLSERRFCLSCGTWVSFFHSKISNFHIFSPWKRLQFHDQEASTRGVHGVAYELLSRIRIRILIGRFQGLCSWAAFTSVVLPSRWTVREEHPGKSMKNPKSGYFDIILTQSPSNWGSKIGPKIHQFFQFLDYSARKILRPPP